jgi:cytochrome c556
VNDSFFDHAVKRIVSPIIVALSLLSFGALAATSKMAATPEIVDAIKSRKANYKDIGGGFKTINDEVKTGAPSIDTIQPLAKEILKRGSMQMNFFPVGSGPESGEKTRAKAQIWSELDNFRKLNQDFLNAAEQLNSAIDGGNVATITSAQKSLGQSCKGCHDHYREAE